MRISLAAALIGGCLCLAGGVLLVRSLLPEPAAAEIVAELEVGHDAAPGVENEAVLHVRNIGGRATRLLNIPGG